jgi:hypothetical protein
MRICAGTKKQQTYSSTNNGRRRGERWQKDKRPIPADLGKAVTDLGVLRVFLRFFGFGKSVRKMEEKEATAKREIGTALFLVFLLIEGHGAQRMETGTRQKGASCAKANSTWPTRRKEDRKVRVSARPV